MIKVQNLGLLNLADANLDEESNEKGFWGKVDDGFRTAERNTKEFFTEDFVDFW